MKNKIIFTLLLGLLTTTPTLAQDAGGDLSIESIQAKESVISGKQVNLYATVKNNSDKDLLGTVKFYDETKGAFVGGDEPVSIVAGGTDEVFVSWKAEEVGNKTISARVVPWENQGDDENNNKTTTKIYVDLDSDGDGQPNAQDADDDNDGVNDDADAFSEDAEESEDSDGDGIGNNSDDDDDNDNVKDLEDTFPKDAKETKDTDLDGVGDQADAFPDNPKETIDEDGDGIGKNADIDDQNLGPKPQISIEETTVMVGSKFSLNALASKDPDGKVRGYEWIFGDKTKASGIKVEKEFEEAGNYKVTLKATDDKGESRTTEITMTVIKRWQSLPFLISFIIFGLILVAGGVYFFRKRGGKTGVKTKKPLPRKRK